MEFRCHFSPVKKKNTHAAEGSQIFLTFISVLIPYCDLVRACARTHARTHFLHHVKAAVHNTTTAEEAWVFLDNNHNERSQQPS